MRFRHKPLVVDAEQFDPLHHPWPAGVSRHTGHWTEPANRLSGDKAASLYSPNYGFLVPGYVARITAGDWVVTDSAGDRYVIRKKVFLQLYDPM